MSYDRDISKANTLYRTIPGSIYQLYHSSKQKWSLRHCETIRVWRYQRGNQNP